MTTFAAGAGGLRIACDVGGPEDGPGVVLVHGGGQTRHSWSRTWSRLIEGGWRAVSVDLRGHGESDWSPDADYSLDVFAEDLLLVAATFDRPPVLVGASLGGLASMVAVVDPPGPQTDRAAALVLVDVAHRLEQAGQGRIGDFMQAAPDGFGSLEEVADAVAAYNPHRPRPTDLSGLAKNLRRREDGRWIWHWDPSFITQGGRARGGGSSLTDPDRLARTAAAITLPTLLVRGRSSDLLSEEGAREFLQLVPHAEYADVAGAGHMVAGDRNEIFNAAILTFLDLHRPVDSQP